MTENHPSGKLTTSIFYLMKIQVGLRPLATYLRRLRAYCNLEFGWNRVKNVPNMREAY
ncbi:hypothetical protein [Liquorilactobacillus uvarum]|uniref:hypothetical protein n=1 Tax=Liquorilactobacillus uvarum TaxID=303240 RepID=UPI0012ED1521|nr:hypothetical protein [Liquorilactobacillus uvarum]